jgi:hypothetical protein
VVGAVGDEPRPELSGPEALERLLVGRRGRREFAPVRRGFLQQRHPGGGPAALASFVGARRTRALNIYLLVHSLASTPPWDVGFRTRQLSTALGMPDTAASRVSVTRSLNWLEEVRLIRSEKDGSLRRVVLLDETASGRPYAHPARSRQPDYFKLPYAYWLEGWFQKLSLPAIAVLLIGLSLDKSFLLPLDNGARWYGVSRDTLRRGIRELIRADLLTFHVKWKRAPNSPTGTAEERRYVLKGPFAVTGAPDEPRSR